jgi:hypothetical protein
MLPTTLPLGLDGVSSQTMLPNFGRSGLWETGGERPSVSPIVKIVDLPEDGLAVSHPVHATLSRRGSHVA